MEISTSIEGREHAIVDLFTQSFTASEGAEEGGAIGGLVRSLLGTTAPEDIACYSALDGDVLAGCIVFSRLTYDQDDRTVFVLGPVAIRPDRQGKGHGRNLLTHGLAAMRERGVDIVVTYGDPAYYTKVGFHQITEDFAQAPFRLNYPHGWMGQSLTDQEFLPLAGPARCVEAFNSPEFW